MTEACIFDLGHFRGTDGPGLRTIVFFKGCPLRCQWCSNPFGLSPRPELAVKRDGCTGCGACQRYCSQGAVVCEAGKSQLDRSLCTACGHCTKVCPGRLRVVTGQGYTVSELFEEIKKDAPFYRRGGGVTLSGGEVLLQHEAATALLRLCRKHYINTCIETSGYGSWNGLTHLAQWSNLVFVDIKHMDSQAHQRGCGQGNELILENIRKLAAMVADTGKPARLVIRVPLIPGYNCDEDNLNALTTFVSGLAGEPEVNLLPYHALGAGRYEQIGLDYKMASWASYEKQEAQEPYVYVKHRLKDRQVTLGGEAIADSLSY